MENKQTEISKLKSKMFSKLSDSGIKPGKAMPIIRVALVGKLEGPDLFDLIKFLGINETTKRLSLLQDILTKI